MLWIAWIGGSNLWMALCLESKTLISLLFLTMLDYRYQLPRFSWLTRTMRPSVGPFWRRHHTGLATVSSHGSTTANLVAVAKTSMRHGVAIWPTNATESKEGWTEGRWKPGILIFDDIWLYLTPSRYDLVNSDKTIGWSLAALLQTTSEVQSRAGTCEVWGFKKWMCASDALDAVLDI